MIGSRPDRQPFVVEGHALDVSAVRLPRPAHGSNERAAPPFRERVAAVKRLRPDAAITGTQNTTGDSMRARGWGAPSPTRVPS